MLALLALLTTAQATDLLVPSFSLSPGSEPAGAEIMYSAVLEALRSRDVEFLDADDITELAGDKGKNCAARPECPEVLWEKLKGKLAMTATVGLKGETLTVTVNFHRPGKKEPVEFVQDELHREGCMEDQSDTGQQLQPRDRWALQPSIGPGYFRDPLWRCGRLVGVFPRLHLRGA